MKTRRSKRSNSCFRSLAELIVRKKRALFLCGAGLSAASGIPTFRGQKDSVWSTTIMTIGTRKAFLKVVLKILFKLHRNKSFPRPTYLTNDISTLNQDPIKWYNDYWLQKYAAIDHAKPNAAHFALAAITQAFPKVWMAWI